MRIAIIGYGVVGHNMQKLFPASDIIDPPKNLYGSGVYDVAFVCVPTDMLDDGSCDTSIVESVVRQNRARVFCIKSTIPPGTTEQIAELTGKRCVFSPEYFGGTQHANSVDYDFVILGGNREDTVIVAEVYKEIRDGGLKIFQTDSRTAELVKYAENSFLYAKVVFVNEFARICQAFGVDVNEWRELWLQDPRIGRSHSFYYPDKPFVRSHCLSKDVPAIIESSRMTGYDPEFLREMVRVNLGWIAEFESGERAT